MRALIDGQRFRAYESQIYIAIPRGWFLLGLMSGLNYYVMYKSLSQAQFVHLLDGSHNVYQSKHLKECIEGSRTA